MRILRQAVRTGVSASEGTVVIKRIWLVAVCVVAGVRGETAVEREVLLDDCRDPVSWRENMGREFPGATGEVGPGTAPDGTQCVRARLDFRGGGRYAGMERIVRIPQTSVLSFQVWSEGFKRGMVRLRDVTNQEHAAGFSVTPGRWSDVRLSLTPAVFSGHWHGADDGRFHWPVRRMLVAMQPGPERTGRVFLRNVTLRTAAPGVRWEVRVGTLYPGNVAFLDECPASVTVRLRNRLREMRNVRVTWEIADADGRRVVSGGRPEAVGPWGTVERNIQLDPRRPGWYHVQVRVLEAGRQVGGGEGAVGIVARPRNLERDDDFSFFGMHPSDPAAASRIGVKWARLQRAWWWGESIKGRYYWPDKGLDSARERHIKVLLTLHYGPPGWAVKEIGKDKVWPPPKKLLDDWAGYVRACVERYRGKVACYEIQNEPDLTCWRQPKLSFEDGVRSYVAIFRRAAAVIRELDPGVPIAGVDVSGGDYRSRFRYSKAVLEKIAPLLDVYTGHPYASPRYFGSGKRPLLPFRNRLIEKLRSSQVMLRAFGCSDRVWVGEKGWGLDIREPLDGPYSFAYARCVARALITGRSVPGVDRWFWFLQNGCNERGYEYGLWRGDVAQPLPAAVAYAAAARFLYHAVPASREPALPQGLRGFVFRCADLERAVVSIWSLQDDYRLRADWPEGTAAFDMWGRACNVGAGLRISQAPVYLTAPLRAADRLMRVIETAHFEPGRPVRVESVRFRTIDRLAVSLVSRVDREVRVEVRAGKRSGSFRLPGMVARTAFLPVERLGVDGSVRAAAPLSVRVLVDGATLWSGDVPQRFLPCVRRPPGLGSGMRFPASGAPALRLDRREFLLPPDPNIGWSGPADLSATARWSWDRKAFYLEVAVRDDVHAAPFTGRGNFWKSDSLQVAFDPENDAGPDTEFDEDDREFGCVLGSDGARVFRTFPAPYSVVSFPCRVRREKDVTVYVLAVPWSALGIRPKAGRVFSLDFIVNDNDGNGRGYWLGPRPGIGEAKRPGRFLDLVLSE
ncbi:MAG: hypothetical protein GXP31_11775 [Kiritimatiellaeota bacterium]|nr:hypothetical protein [Kiritimatiellota bacterium]